MAKLVLATHNTHKVKEVWAALAPHVPNLELSDLVSAAELGAPEPVEDGISFAQNSLIKARALAKFTGLPALADDSGLSVDVLGGAPGIFSARWAGSHGQDDANLDLLLAQLADVSAPNRGAAFVCAASLVLPTGEEFVELAEQRGTLLYERRGEGGFGYDPIFLGEGQEKTNAELSPAEKNAISHRGQAFKSLAPHVAAVL